MPIERIGEVAMLPKSILALSAAIVMAGSSAALAAKSSNQQKGAAAFAQSVPARISSTAVFADGKIIGRDPDGNVRLQLLRDYGSRNR